MKKLLAIVLTLALCMGLVVLPASAEEVAKPEKITIFVDGTVFTESNAQDKFIERWEELSGIELEIIQPDHDAYYDVLQQTDCFRRMARCNDPFFHLLCSLCLRRRAVGHDRRLGEQRHQEQRPLYRR